MSTIIPTIYESIVCPTGPGNPRNGEAAIVELSNGKLLLAYTRFGEWLPGSVDADAIELKLGSDHYPADIRACFSKDDGYTWSDPCVFQENVGAISVIGPAFLRLRSGTLLFAFEIKNDATDDTHAYVRSSIDEAHSWSEPVLATPEDGYVIANQGSRCMVQTNTGRVLMPASKAIDIDEDARAYHMASTCFSSDDEGRTWKRNAEYMDLPDTLHGLQEPGIVVLSDGTLWMYMRTELGTIYSSYSTNDGDNWSTPAPTELIAPLSPATGIRIPCSTDLLMIYNDRSTEPHSPELSDAFQKRSPLSSAISSDGGRTWHHHKTIEPDETKSYTYTNINFHKGSTLLTYYVGPVEIGGAFVTSADLKLKIVPTVAWAQ